MGGRDAPNPPPDEATTEALAAGFKDVLMRGFLRRVRPRERMLLTLGCRPMLLRCLDPNARLPEEPQLILGIFDDESDWRVVSDVASVLEELVVSSASVASVKGWNAALLHYVALAAAEVAGRLITELGATPCLPSGLPVKPPDYRVRAELCRRDAQAAQSIPEECVGTLLEAMGGVSGQSTHHPAALLLRRDPTGVQVEGIDMTGQTLWTEAAGAFCDRVATQAARSMEHNVRNALAGVEKHTAVASQYLAGHPEFKEAVSTAASGECVGLRLARGTHNGGPVDVVLYLDSGEHCGPGVAFARGYLYVIRGFRDFLLQYITGEWSYFPPSALVARLEFPFAVGDRRHDQFRVRTPLVRNYAGGYFRTHYYTGDLHKTETSTARVLNPHPDGNVVPGMCEEAKEQLGKKLHRTRTGRERDICLERQNEVINELNRMVIENNRRGKMPPVMRIVKVSWDTARSGLTRSVGYGPPRRADMAYPVMCPEIFSDPGLRQRTFPLTKKRGRPSRHLERLMRLGGIPF